MLDVQTIPIDIHQNKLLDWLVSRRIVNRDWQRAVLVIRQRINAAIQDMPAVDEITNLLAGSYINYFHCCRIVEILKETEKSSKNIFGMYSSQRMKDWLEIIQLYKKDNVYLAEAAQMLMRNVNYEIPSLKKQLTKCVQMQEECLKKQSDYAKSATELKERYSTSCSQIGIEGKNIKKELLSLLDELPESFVAVTNSVKNLKSAIELYRFFVTFTINRKDVDEFCLPVLKYLLEKGNTSTYEWRTGELPDVVEVVKPVLPLDVDNGSTEAGDDQIDFGDFAITSESSDDRSSSSPNGDFVHVDKEDCKGEASDQIDFGDADSEVNWDITVESVDTTGITVLNSEKDNKGGKVAEGEDALSLLENSRTRTLFFNELLELESFLKQRLMEMSEEEAGPGISSNVLCSDQLHFTPHVGLLQSQEEMQNLLSVVESVISQATSVKLKNLLLIKESPKYVDRLTSSLKDILDASDKMLLSKQVAQMKFEESVKEQARLEPKIKLIITKTEELQKQIAADISKRYTNRPVNIMGMKTH